MRHSGKSRSRAGAQPHSLAQALAAVRAEVAPLTLLAAVQEAWLRVAGSTVAGQADPVAERDGVVTISCRSATWAQELDLMQNDLRAKLQAELEGGAFAEALTGLRFRADAARADPPR